MQCACTILSSVACIALLNFSSFSHKRARFSKRKTLLNTKYVFWCFLQRFSDIFLSLNQNSIQEEIKSRLKLGNACYYLVQNLLSSSLLSKNLKIKIYRTIILPVVLYGCETWSLTLREERNWGCWGEYLGLRGTR